LVFVAQAAHEAAARSGYLRGIQRREALVLRDARLDGAQFRKPAGAAVLSRATANAVEAPRLVPHADVPHLHARAEQSLELVDELAEIDALLGREIDRELLAVPLPLGVGYLQLELLGADLLDGPAPHGVLVGSQLR